MDHMQYLLVRSHNPEQQTIHHPMENPEDPDQEHMSGHALMATAPPHSHIMTHPDEPYPCKIPGQDEGLGKEGLARLLDLSNRLPFDHYSEITPVMAWTAVVRHPRLSEITNDDFENMRAELGTKIRCYGFV